MSKQVYQEKDVILPNLSLKSPVRIRIEIDDENVLLFVGPRDWQWDRKTREFIGAGTRLT